MTDGEDKKVTVHSAMKEYAQWVQGSIREGMDSHLKSVHEFLKLMIGLGGSSLVVTLSMAKFAVPEGETLGAGWLLATCWGLQLFALALLLSSTWKLAMVQKVDMIPSNVENIVMDMTTAIVDHSFSEEILAAGGSDLPDKIEEAVMENVGTVASTVESVTDGALESHQRDYNVMIGFATWGSVVYFFSLVGLTVWAVLQHLS